VGNKCSSNPGSLEGSWSLSHNHKVSQATLGTMDWQYWLQEKSTVPTSLVSSAGIWWQWLLPFGRPASEKKSTISLPISQAPSWEVVYCLRLSYSEDLKARNYHKSGSLRTPCYSGRVGDIHMRQSWKRDRSDMDQLTSLCTRELGPWRGTVVSGPILCGEE
jgi:hypothetical protein